MLDKKKWKNRKLFNEELEEQPEMISIKKEDLEKLQRAVITANETIKELNEKIVFKEKVRVAHVEEKSELVKKHKVEMEKCVEKHVSKINEYDNSIRNLNNQIDTLIKDSIEKIQIKDNQLNRAKEHINNLAESIKKYEKILTTLKELNGIQLQKIDEFRYHSTEYLTHF